ncbi:hypothetical protein [Thalassomonas actiniarum]|uniref:DUF4124 domain-containing protein n=1 Tax=Thalassomonas actiniarum TaxID=485447 RepID=A0AAE9YPN8_9GAMM|nr:hypothetical protein [Thalassomonas actiniarum]WDD98506.1 hypothetical protein SG35_025170 [Thalassomonas actiniarum]
MRFFFGLAIGLLLLNQAAKAETIVLFTADEQCHSRETSKGIRYIPPCSLSDTDFTFTLPGDNGGDIDSSTETQNLSLNFHCESLRPLSIEYQISQQEHIIISGKLAPSQDNAQLNASISLLEPAGHYQLRLIKINGMKGFQAIKPDCRLTLEINAKTDAELSASTGD